MRHSQLRPGIESWLLYAGVVFLCLVQQPGRTTLDTRLELATRPGSFLAGAFDLWHPATNFGELQNQAYGYLFPQGAYFWLADLAHVPTWAAQRFWMALVLVVALEGARRVALVAGLSRGPAFLAALAFGLSPRIVSTVGVLSAETLPGAVLPWAVLPIILVMRRRLTPLRGAVLSAAAVVCMGGVNAVEVIGSLPLPLALVLWATAVGLVARRFAVWWLGAVAMASAWWMLPLLVLGAYSPPFYAYVESAANTTSLIGPAKALRGGSHWVGYLTVGSDPWWPAAFELNYTSYLVVVAAAVSAMGLVGLALWPNRLRTPLVLAVVLGIVSLTISYGSWTGSPLAGVMRGALDGALQMFRNVHKVDPTVRLPLALGFGHAAGLMAARLRTVRGWSLAPAATWLVVPGVLVASLGQPLLTNHTRTPGWTELSQPWVQAHDYLVREQRGTRTLVLPGAGFAHQTWGWTLDEPFLAWDDVDFVTRSQIPLVPGETMRFLAELDDLVGNGRATPALVEQLARVGIGHVLLRRDLDRTATRSPHPGGSLVSIQSAGLKSVAQFGERRDGGPEIEIFRVPGATGPVRVVDVDDVRTVSGTPESVLGLVSSGVVRPDEPVVLAGEPGWSAESDVVTDSNTRRERAFGGTAESLSQPFQAGEDWRINRAVHRFPAGHSPEVFADFGDVRLVTASSSQAYADTWGPVVPAAGPGAVLDGDARSRWVSSPGTTPEEQWLQFELGEQRRIGRVRIVPVQGDPSVAEIRRLRVIAGPRTQEVEVNPTGVSPEVDMGGIEARTLRIEVVAAAGQGRGMVGVNDVLIDGLDTEHSLALPDAVRGNDTLSLSAEGPTSACRQTVGLPDCDLGRLREAPEVSGMVRTVRFDSSAMDQITGTVVRRMSSEALALLEDSLSGQHLSVSSVVGADPMAAGPFGLDGDLNTAWRPSPWDLRPTLTLSWDEPQRVTGIRVRGPIGTDLGFRRAVVTARGEEQTAVFQGDTALVDPIKAREVSIAFEPSSDRMVVPEIELIGADTTRPIDLNRPTGRFCGFGPPVYIDGRKLPTEVTGTLEDVVLGRPMLLKACSPGDETDAPAAEVLVGQGNRTIRTDQSAEFVVTGLTFTPASTPTAAVTERDVRISRWTPSTRVMEVGAGPRSLLRVSENFNRGWEATIDGAVLPAVHVDGWQQGWVLPASSDGTTVSLRMAPQQTYTVALGVGLALAVGLLLCAGWILLRRRRTVVDADGITWSSSGAWPWQGSAALAVVLAVTFSPWAAAAMAVAVSFRRLSPSALLGTAGLLVVVSGAVEGFSLRTPPRLSDFVVVIAVGLACGVATRAASRAPHYREITVLPAWRGPQGWLAAGVLGGVLAWRWLLLSDSFWNQDDYYMVADALGRPLDAAYLFQDVYGHLIPGKLLAYWLVAHVAPFDWGVVAASLALGHLVAGWLMWILLTELLPGRWIRVPLFAAFMLSSSSLAPTLWWSAGMTVWTHVIGALVSVIAMVRSVQGTGRVWLNHALVIGGVAFGLVTSEQPILITILVAAVAVLMQPGRGWRRVWGALRRWWGLWSVMTVGAVAYLVTHAMLADVASSPPESLAEGGRIVWAMVGRNVIPGLVSGPWQVTLEGGAVVPATWVVVVSSVLFAAVVLVMLLRGGSSARWALFFGVVYVAVAVALVVSSRGGFGKVIGLDPRYTYDLLHVAVILLAVVIAVSAPPARDMGPRSALALSVAYLVGTLATVNVLVPHFQNPEDRQYVANFRADLARDANQVVLDGPVPAEIVLPLVGEGAQASSVFRPLPDSPAFDLPTRNLTAIAEDGHLVPVRFREATKASMIPRRNKEEACGYNVRPGLAKVIPLHRAVLGPEVAAVFTQADRVFDLDVTIGEEHEVIRVFPGDDRVWIPLSDAGLVNRITVQVRDPETHDRGARVCVVAVDVGMPDLPGG